MNTLVFTLALIFLPGIIWARLDAKYASQAKPSQVDLLLNVFVFGLVSYVATYLIYLVPPVARVASFDLTTLEVDDERAPEILTRVIVDDILVATSVGLALTPAWLAAKRRKLVTRALKAIGATKRYGDEDVWDFVLNAEDPLTKYVHVRDAQTGLTFAGYVAVFSERPELRELVLSEVRAYDTASGVRVLEVPRLYLAREPQGMTLEFPADPSHIVGGPARGAATEREP